MSSTVEFRRSLKNGESFLAAVLTEIPVLQLAVSEKSDFLAADVAVFFVKQSHNVILRLCFIFLYDPFCIVDL